MRSVNAVVICSKNHVQHKGCEQQKKIAAVEHCQQNDYTQHSQAIAVRWWSTAHEQL